MTQITKAALLGRIEALEKSLKRETALREREAAERARFEKALGDALAQQTATSEILRVISQSRTDVQPVFDAILRSAVRLCHGLHGTVLRVDGGMVHVVAVLHPRPEEVAAVYPAPLTSALPPCRAIRENTVIHVPDVEAVGAVPREGLQVARAATVRSVLVVPMRRDGEAFGAILIARPAPGPFAGEQIALLQTFADQAVIAIENVRLFTETKEALERQTATSEILRVISTSAADVQPVFDVIAWSAGRLCEAEDVSIFRRDGDRALLVAHHGSIPSEIVGEFAIPLSGPMRTLMESAQIFHVADLQTESECPEISENARRLGFRAALGVPLVREGVAIGAITLRRTEARLFSERQVALLQTFADQAVIAIENVRLFTELRASNRGLRRALDQQTATAEILRVISGAHTDAQPVFDTIVQSALRLLNGHTALVLRVKEEMLYLAALTSTGDVADDAVRATFPHAVGGDDLASHVARTGRPYVVSDTETDPLVSENIRRTAPLRGYRSMVFMPMLWDRRVIGILTVTRQAPGGFSEEETALLRTFADQALIAIENVRLFKELEERNSALAEALEQQTGTSEILQVISSSPTDVHPVFAAMARSAARLCHAADAAIFQVDAGALRLVAHDGLVPLGSVGEFTVPLVRGSLTGRVALEGRTIQIADHQAEGDEYPDGTAIARRYDVRTMLGVPLVRAGETVGVIALRRTEVRLFTDRQIELLKTFADQAVIAIENVRLFKELEARNRDLTEALEQQTATSEILRVISSSPTGVQPTFEAIARAATVLCEADNAGVFRFDGALIHFVAQHGRTPEEIVMTQRAFPQPPRRHSVAARAILDGAVVQIADASKDPELEDSLRIFRTVLSVPLLRDGRSLGAITVVRGVVRPFTDKQIALLRTFADQAVIAIENVRLFRELEARNRDLTESLEQQTATSAVLRVISESPTDTQPVFDAIADHALRLCSASVGSVLMFDGALLHIVARANFETDSALARAFPMRPSHSGSASARAILTRQVVHLPDVFADPTYDLPEQATAAGFRAALAVPMLHDEKPIGCITVGRGQPGAYSERQIALLQTFADQAVIAIENVRLFKELEGRNRDLTATSEILQVISRSPTDVQPVFDTIAERAMRLCNAALGVVCIYDSGLIHLGALANVRPEGADALRKAYPRAPSRGSNSGRVILTGDVVEIPDVLADPEYQLTGPAAAADYRSTLGVPMLHQGRAIGVIIVSRPEPGAFAGEQIQLLRTFADQAVIAVENVRLFKELEARNSDLSEALEQQTATSEILGVISHSQTDVQPVFETVAENAVRLCEAERALIFRFDGEFLQAVASYNASPELIKFVERNPIVPGRHSGTARAALERQTIHIADVRADPEYSYGAAQVDPVRTVLGVPMLKGDSLVGVITIFKLEVKPFTDNQIALVETFADQAVIAIENVRLFKELEVRTAELTRSVEELKALGEVSRAVSSTLDLETVLTTIVERAVQLSAATGGVIYEYDEGEQAFGQIRAAHRLDHELSEVIRARPIRLGEGVSGKAAALRAPVQVPDILDEETYDVARIRTILERYGYRALLAVPLLFEERILGVLTVWRQEPGSFASEVVNLLQTFATQSVLAIQNARLFRELADTSRELEVASQHKSEFLANMSHELRTPLNAIIGFSEVLLERMFGEVNEKQTEYLQDILSSGQHLLSLINDILDLSKIEAGRMELALAPFDLPQALENAVTLVKERAARHGIALRLDVDPRLGELVADERKIKQVLLNLLSNAVKFTPEGGRISLTAGIKDASVEIAVSDTGVGIAPEDQEAIFEEFRQVGGDYTRKLEGTGLGLTLTKKFVEMHGGRIWVQSAVGRGSTFTFTLPLGPETRSA